MTGILAFYESNADRYVAFERRVHEKPEDFPLLAELRAREQELLKGASGRKAFYFATGSGTNPLILAQEGAKVATLDFSEAMLAKAAELFDAHQVGYRKVGNDAFSQQMLDDLADGQIMVIHGDFRDTNFSDGYFDDCFCYCTLPLLGDAWKTSLEKLLTISRSGAMSVYDREQLGVLGQYYAKAGFKPRVEGRTIFKEGGFAYECLSPEEIGAVIRPKKKLVTEQAGLGKLYLWTEPKD